MNRRQNVGKRLQLLDVMDVAVTWGVEEEVIQITIRWNVLLVDRWTAFQVHAWVNCQYNCYQHGNKVKETTVVWYFNSINTYKEKEYLEQKKNNEKINMQEQKYDFNIQILLNAMELLNALIQYWKWKREQWWRY